METGYPITFELSFNTPPSVLDFLPLFLLAGIWLALTLPPLVVLARRKLETPYWGMVFGGIGLLAMPPLGIIYLMALTLFRDRRPGQ